MFSRMNQNVCYQFVQSTEWGFGKTRKPFCIIQHLRNNLFKIPLPPHDFETILVNGQMFYLALSTCLLPFGQ